MRSRTSEPKLFYIRNGFILRTRRRNWGAHLRDSVPIEYTEYRVERVRLGLMAIRGGSPFESWIVDATGSIPARIPLYRTSEWEMREMGFLWYARQHAAHDGREWHVPDETESGHGDERKAKKSGDALAVCGSV